MQSLGARRRRRSPGRAGQRHGAAHGEWESGSLRFCVRPSPRSSVHCPPCVKFSRFFASCLEPLDESRTPDNRPPVTALRPPPQKKLPPPAADPARPPPRSRVLLRRQLESNGGGLVSSPGSAATFASTSDDSTSASISMAPDTLPGCRSISNKGGEHLVEAMQI